MTSPKQLRIEIQDLRSSVGTLRDILVNKVRDPREPTWGIGRDCAKTAEALNELLTSQVAPEWYKVAVVGRFKAGKSAFVNELLGARLAGEDTSPETAAVTSFRHGEQIKAEIRFVSRENWERLRQLYMEDPKHIDAHRMKMWMSFDGKANKNSDGEVIETFNLSSLENTFIKPGGYSIELVLNQQGGRKSEGTFRRNLKEFTTGTRPHHCLVESIEITSPSPLLDEGVLLIDTPGLDDTERFRVALTEKAVEDVDAVLFLTQSGVAYGQSEKDFILTLLRRGTVKQLIFVITQVDKTYEQHLAAAYDNDEDAETIAQRIQREERRIRDEIEATLNELSSEDSPAMRRYREQLGMVGLVFTSARKHRDWKDGNKVEHWIHPEDPGGIERMKSQLLELLSSESRLVLVAHNIAKGTKSALDDLLAVIDNRLTAMREIKDSEVAEKRLAAFRRDFEKSRKTFLIATESDVALLRKNLADSLARNDYLIENIGLIAERELAEFEILDVGKHWRTRRSGNWGYMYNLQGRVANKIFPRVQQMLSDMTEHFASFVKHFESHISRLSESSDRLAEELELGATIPFDLTKTLSGSLDKSLVTANDLIASEEQRIISLLDDFVSEEVSDKISAARDKVSHIFGRGTTYSQSLEVRTFYIQVKRLLQQALTDHLRRRCGSFAQFLALEANNVPHNSLAEVQATLASAEQDIKAAAMAVIGSERDDFEKDCDVLSDHLKKVIDACTRLLQGEDFQKHEEGEPITSPKPIHTSNTVWVSEAPGRSWIELVQREATTKVHHYSLGEGDSGWTLNRIFTVPLISGSTRIALIDPCLSKPHQIRTLTEFLMVVAEISKPKEILVITSNSWSEGNGVNVRVIGQFSEDLFASFGTTLSVHIDTDIHDRYVVCDNGVLFKLGCGLDIYKSTTGLSSHRAGNRRVRRTDIDVFAMKEWCGRQ